VLASQFVAYRTVRVRELAVGSPLPPPSPAGVVVVPVGITRGPGYTWVDGHWR
jgi:hypothetical protein